MSCGTKMAKLKHSPEKPTHGARLCKYPSRWKAAVFYSEYHRDATKRQQRKLFLKQLFLRLFTNQGRGGTTVKKKNHVVIFTIKCSKP